MTIEPTSWEIHFHKPSIGDSFVRRHGRKIKRVGGSYSACYGHDQTRVVHIDNTPEGREVLDGILRTDAPTSVIARGLPHAWPAWVIVTHPRTTHEARLLSTALLDAKLQANIAQARARGIIE